MASTEPDPNPDCKPNPETDPRPATHPNPDSNPDPNLGTQPDPKPRNVTPTPTLTSTQIQFPETYIVFLFSLHELKSANSWSTVSPPPSPPPPPSPRQYFSSDLEELRCRISHQINVINREMASSIPHKTTHKTSKRGKLSTLRVLILLF